MLRNLSRGKKRLNKLKSTYNLYKVIKTEIGPKSFVLWQTLIVVSTHFMNTNNLRASHVFIYPPVSYLQACTEKEPFKFKHAGGRNTKTDRSSTSKWFIQFDLCCAQETHHERIGSLYQERPEWVTSRARPTVKLTRDKFIPGHIVWPECDL